MATNKQEEYGKRQSDRTDHQENLEVQRNKQSEPGGQSGNQVDDSMNVDDTVNNRDTENIQMGGNRGPSNENTNS